MADEKSESITVNVKKKQPSDKSPTKAQKKGGGYLAEDTHETAENAPEDNSQEPSRQGTVIQPTKAAKQAAADRTDDGEDADKSNNDGADETEAQDIKSAASAQLNTPVKSDQLPGDKDDVETASLPTDGDGEASDPQELTVAAHATMQQTALADNRDYKISKKQLKKAPQRSGSHIHKTWVFMVLVLAVSVGLAYAYLTAIEGLSFEEITSRLGL